MLDPTKVQGNDQGNVDPLAKPPSSSQGKKLTLPFSEEPNIELMTEGKKLKPGAQKLLSSKTSTKAEVLSPAPRVAKTAQSSLNSFASQDVPSPSLSRPASPSPSLSPLSQSPPSPSSEKWSFLPEEPISNWSFTSPLSFFGLYPAMPSEPVIMHIKQANTKEMNQESLLKALTTIKERKLPATWFPSSLFLKRVEAQTQADLKTGYFIPPNLQTLPKGEFTEGNFSELTYLQTEKGDDLTTPQTVESWKNFYAKLCVIEATLREKNPQIHIEKLSPLFNSNAFQEVLKKGRALFGQFEGDIATGIVNTFEQTAQRWNKVLKANLQSQLQEVTSGSIAGTNPLKSLSQLLVGFPLMQQAAIELRKSKENFTNYLSGLNPDQKKELCNIKHFKEEIRYFLDQPTLPTLKTQTETEKWKLFYAKISILNEVHPSLLKPFEHSILKEILKQSIGIFKAMDDDQGNALEIATTCETLLGKISHHEKREKLEAAEASLDDEGLEVKENKENKKEERVQPPPLSLKQTSALIGIRYPCDEESKEIWGAMYVGKKGSYLKERAVLMAQAQATGQQIPPSKLTSKNYTSITKELNKSGLHQLLRNNSIDLTNNGHVTLLQSFYAKMCVVNEEFIPENLTALFAVEGFLPTLEKAIVFFDQLADQNANARQIAQVLKNVSDRYYYSQLSRSPSIQNPTLPAEILIKIHNKDFTKDLNKIEENLNKLNKYSHDEALDLNKIKEIKFLLIENNNLIKKHNIPFQKNHQTAYLHNITTLIQQTSAQWIGPPLDHFFNNIFEAPEIKNLKLEISKQELDKNHTIQFTKENFAKHVAIKEEIKEIVANFAERDETLKHLYTNYITMHGLLAKTGIKQDEYVGIITEIGSYCVNQRILLSRALGAYTQSHRHEPQQVGQLTECFTRLDKILENFSALRVEDLNKDTLPLCADRLGYTFSENISIISDFLKLKIQEEKEFIEKGGNIENYFENECRVGEGASATYTVRYALQALGRVKSLLDELNSTINKKEASNQGFKNPLEDVGLFIEAHLKHTVPEIATKAVTQESAGGKPRPLSKISNPDKTIKEAYLINNAVLPWQAFKTALQLHDI